MFRAKARTSANLRNASLLVLVAWCVPSASLADVFVVSVSGKDTLRSDGYAGSTSGTTGINILAGDFISIRAADDSTWGGGPVGPDDYGSFSPDHAVPESSGGGLLGSIGDRWSGFPGPSVLLDDGIDYNAALGQTGTDVGIPGVFGTGYVGSIFPAVDPWYIAPIDGELFLGVNDNFFSDNTGFLTVIVTVIPEPATLSLLLFGAVMMMKQRRQRRH